MPVEAGKPWYTAGHAIEQHHTGAVYGAGDYAIAAMGQGAFDDAQHQGGNGKAASHNVGDHVEDLFAPGIIRQLTISQLDAHG